MHLELDSGADASSTYPESKSEEVTLINFTSCDDAEDDLGQCNLDTELDLEGEEIIKDIALLEAKGLAKPRYTPRTVTL